MPGDRRAGDRRAREADYSSARRGAGVALVAAAILLVVVDALSTDYAVEPVVLAILLGAAGGLLGVELLSALRGVVR